MRLTWRTCRPSRRRGRCRAGRGLAGLGWCHPWAHHGRGCRRQQSRGTSCQRRRHACTRQGSSAPSRSRQSRQTRPGRARVQSCPWCRGTGLQARRRQGQGCACLASVRAGGEERKKRCARRRGSMERVGPSGPKGRPRQLPCRCRCIMRGVAHCAGCAAALAERAACWIPPPPHRSPCRCTLCPLRTQTQYCPGRTPCSKGYEGWGTGALDSCLLFELRPQPDSSGGAVGRMLVCTGIIRQPGLQVIRYDCVGLPELGRVQQAGRLPPADVPVLMPQWLGRGDAPAA